MRRYCVEGGKRSAKAFLWEANISPKKSMEICRELRGKNIQDAKKLLEDIIAMKKPIPYKRYKRDVPHRKGKGIMAGRYPVKPASEILKLIKGAESNARYKGLDIDALIIMHCSAHRGRILKGRMPRARGRSTDWNEQTTNVQIILEEVD